MAITIFVIVSLYYGCQFLLFASECIGPIHYRIPQNGDGGIIQGGFPEFPIRRQQRSVDTDLLCVNWKEDGF